MWRRANVDALVERIHTAVHREKPWLRPSLRGFDWSLLRSTFSQGIILFLLAASVLAIYQCDKLVIAVVLEPAKVTGYALLGRLFATRNGIQ